jgi:hypothetical protein
MFLRLLLFIPLFRQFMLLEELCDLDGPVWTSDTVDGTKNAARAAAGRVDWPDPRTVNTCATVRLRFGPFYKIIRTPVYVVDVTHAGNTCRYYLTRRGKLFQGYLQSELTLVDPAMMTDAGRMELNRTLNGLCRR